MLTSIFINDRFNLGVNFIQTGHLHIQGCTNISKHFKVEPIMLSTSSLLSSTRIKNTSTHYCGLFILTKSLDTISPEALSSKRTGKIGNRIIECLFHKPEITCLHIPSM